MESDIVCKVYRKTQWKAFHHCTMINNSESGKFYSLICLEIIWTNLMRGTHTLITLNASVSL